MSKKTIEEMREWLLSSNEDSAYCNGWLDLYNTKIRPEILEMSDEEVEREYTDLQECVE